MICHQQIIRKPASTSSPDCTKLQCTVYHIKSSDNKTKSSPSTSTTALCCHPLLKPSQPDNQCRLKPSWPNRKPRDAWQSDSNPQPKWQHHLLRQKAWGNGDVPSWILAKGFLPSGYLSRFPNGVAAHDLVLPPPLPRLPQKHRQDK